MENKSLISRKRKKKNLTFPLLHPRKGYFKKPPHPPPCPKCGSVAFI